MWNDVEAKVDLLNFSHVAAAAAQLIKDSDGQPLTIGVSGNWGAGKSSLVKMIGQKLDDAPDGREYIFLEFNAWLYQGYDDARQALLDAVADRLLVLAKSREKNIDKVYSFIKRINLLKLGKILAPIGIHALTGGAIGGPVGAILGTLSGIAQAGKIAESDVKDISSSYNDLKPDIAGLLKEKSEQSLPKEIEGLRNAFADLLVDLDVTLVVLVDDLDRCLPDTAINTLEAMRLLLHVENTAFIIAADESMIRSAVRAHFKDTEINNDLVTSYFDKLIQIPLQVPRLGTTEVKAYLILLLADLAYRRRKISESVLKVAQEKILLLAKIGWAGLSVKDIRNAFGNESDKISREIDLADQLAPIMAGTEQISGNPRLIKRFLNNLVIREMIAKSRGMTIGFEELVKIQLFERCASAAGFEYLAKEIAASDDGKAGFLVNLEESAQKGETLVLPSVWSQPFYEQWIKMAPPLGSVDLRPLLHLSKDRRVAIAAYDELSQNGLEILEALFNATAILPILIDQIKSLDENEAERVFIRLGRRARTEQFSSESLIRCINVTKAFPSLSHQLLLLLKEIPANHRPIALIPILQNEAWAESELHQWAENVETPTTVKKAILAKKGKK